jgi:hypothetical protein
MKKESITKIELNRKTQLQKLILIDFQQKNYLQQLKKAEKNLTTTFKLHKKI